MKTEIEDYGEYKVLSDTYTQDSFIPFEIRTSNTKSLCFGTYIFSKDIINIFFIQSNQKGDMKKLINYLVGKFETNNIRFFGVINKVNFYFLRGFKEEYIYDYMHQEHVLCLTGKWE